MSMSTPTLSPVSSVLILTLPSFVLGPRISTLQLALPGDEDGMEVLDDRDWCTSSSRSGAPANDAMIPA